MTVDLNLLHGFGPRPLKTQAVAIEIGMQHLSVFPRICHTISPIWQHDMRFLAPAKPHFHFPYVNAIKSKKCAHENEAGGEVEHTIALSAIIYQCWLLFFFFFFNYIPFRAKALVVTQTSGRSVFFSFFF